MRRIAIALCAGCALIITSVATAQTIKQNKDGTFQVTTPSGDKMTVDKSGNIVDHEQRGGIKTKLSKSDGGTKTLNVGGNSEKKPRQKSGPHKCTSASDLLVENAIIADVDTGVAMVTSCDADVFNVDIDAKQHGIDVVGSGELRLSESEVSGGKIAVNVTGSGDAVIENSVVTGPVAINVTGTGDVVLRNSKVYGKIVITGTGKVINEGGNELVEDHRKAKK